MIIVKAPMRVSFLGGGTDYPDFFNVFEGAVLGCSINKFVYVTLSELSHHSDEKYRFTYRITESVTNPNEFQHPVARAVVTEFADWNKVQLNIGTSSDLPGKSGLGSSSSFTVALIKALKHFGTEVSNYELAEEAIRIERKVLKEPGGIQDQYQASFGGFRIYKFGKDGVVVGEKLLNQEQLDELGKHFLLLKVGGSRDSSKPASVTQNFLNSSDHIENTKLQALEAKRIASLIPGKSVEKVAELLFGAINQSQKWKRNIGAEVIPQNISEVGEQLIQLGAQAYKLLGGGGSGFLLVGGSREAIGSIRQKFQYQIQNFSFEDDGVVSQTF
jgi:D-glycero-alpha-D-manno-heptose-7-phosphate kinase